MSLILGSWRCEQWLPGGHARLSNITAIDSSFEFSAEFSVNTVGRRADETAEKSLRDDAIQMLIPREEAH
jgi:hypothetical protein